MTEILDQVRNPEELRRLPEARLPEVAAAVRGAIIDTISKTGGHLAAGLGASRARGRAAPCSTRRATS
jgi:1-deoxy-D-xylulose-5-phosphate synthase